MGWGLPGLCSGPLSSEPRRVHISQSTMDCLKGEFDVEPGEGGSRCDYLEEKGIETYLISTNTSIKMPPHTKIIYKQGKILGILIMTKG